MVDHNSLREQQRMTIILNQALNLARAKSPLATRVEITDAEQHHPQQIILHGEKDGLKLSVGTKWHNAGGTPSLPDTMADLAHRLEERFEQCERHAAPKTGDVQNG